MGLCGFEGVFRRVMETCMSVLRTNRETLLSVLEPFLQVKDCRQDRAIVSCGGAGWWGVAGDWGWSWRETSSDQLFSLWSTIARSECPQVCDAQNYDSGSDRDDTMLF